MYVCVSVSIRCVCICVCIDLRLGWEPCSVPAWLINGVVMAIGRNEGTERRRPASLDPCAPPGTHTVSHTNSLSRLYTSLTDMLVTQTTLSSWRSCIVVPLLFFSFMFLFLLFSSVFLNFLLLEFTLYSFFLSFFPPHPIPSSSSFFSTQASGHGDCLYFPSLESSLGVTKAHFAFTKFWLRDSVGN